jgi:hypothetical protein
LQGSFVSGFGNGAWKRTLLNQALDAIGICSIVCAIDMGNNYICYRHGKQLYHDYDLVSAGKQLHHDYDLVSVAAGYRYGKQLM